MTRWNSRVNDRQYSPRFSALRASHWNDCLIEGTVMATHVGQDSADAPYYRFQLACRTGRSSPTLKQTKCPSAKRSKLLW